MGNNNNRGLGGLGRLLVVALSDDGGGMSRSAGVVTAAATADAEDDPGPDVGDEDHVGRRVVEEASAATQVVARIAAVTTSAERGTSFAVGRAHRAITVKVEIVSRHTLSADCRIRARNAVQVIAGR